MRHTPFPGPAEVAARTLSAKEQERVEQLRRAAIYGAPDAVAGRLCRLAEAFTADEIVIVTMTHDPADRLHSYQLIAAEMGLARPAKAHVQVLPAESVTW
jgi:alkanesulfonate monooxygenase SsuD/methylene tetrahydromethanopterin reductase-like flavin-dependent oxidoreductase (luciferase family)